MDQKAYGRRLYVFAIVGTVVGAAMAFADAVTGDMARLVDPRLPSGERLVFVGLEVLAPVYLYYLALRHGGVIRFAAAVLATAFVVALAGNALATLWPAVQRAISVGEGLGYLGLLAYTWLRVRPLARSPSRHCVGNRGAG